MLGTQAVGSRAPPALREGESQADTGLFRPGISNKNIRRGAGREGDNEARKHLTPTKSELKINWKKEVHSN